MSDGPEQQVPVRRLTLSEQGWRVLWAVSVVLKLQDREPAPARVKDALKAQGASNDAIIWVSGLPISTVQAALRDLERTALVLYGAQELGQSWRSAFLSARARSLLAHEGRISKYRLPKTPPPPSLPLEAVEALRRPKPATPAAPKTTEARPARELSPLGQRIESSAGPPPVRQPSRGTRERESHEARRADDPWRRPHRFPASEPDVLIRRSPKV